MYRNDRIKARIEITVVMGKTPGRPTEKRSAARLAAIQALYQIDQSGADPIIVVQEFVRFRLGRSFDTGHDVLPDKDFFQEIVGGVCSDRAEIDQIISRSLAKNWKFERLQAILRAILRAGVFEINLKRPVPARVIISEYVDVAYAFYGGQEPGMVNGILDCVARLTRPDEFSCGDTGT